MTLRCPRCGMSNPEVASFCRNCGLPLGVEDGVVLGAGHVRHPQPLPPTEPAKPVEGAVDLHYRWQVAGGGTPLLGTEPLEVWVFNGGYSLAEVAVRIRGEDQAGRELFTTEREIERWLRGASVRLEIPSWELPDPVQTLRVELIQAEFSTPGG